MNRKLRLNTPKKKSQISNNYQHIMSKVNNHKYSPRDIKINNLNSTS